MKLPIALVFIISPLFFNNVSALPVEVVACNQALGKSNGIAALNEVAKLLITNKNDKDALICQGRAFLLTGDYKQALEAFNGATENSQNAFDKSVSSLLAGHAHKALQQFDLAIMDYQQTILHATTANNQAFIRLGHSATGDVHAQNSHLEQALTEYRIASKLAENDNERAESYEKIALTYHHLNQHDAALEYQIKAFLMNEQVGNLDQYAHTSIELGRYYSLTKNYVSAENVLNKIIKFAKDQGGAYFEAQGSYILAKVKVATGDIPAAKLLIAHAKALAKTTNDQALDLEIDQETNGLFKNS